MTTSDSNGNLHARDGKFAEKHHAADDVTLTPAPRTASGVYENMAHARLDSIAANLERIAEEVRRQHDRLAENPVDAATSAVHSVMWGMANLNLDQLVNHAGLIAYHRAEEAGRAND
ncbi:hypothetical protein [Curtobacterium sp. MCBD17_040]|uniref:hypothetical protein n=1 Tax=Curtobacterium sp. MCBD17_040 TaxID=2175674 RepID=UPI000DA7615C|nr:hypothetical protein [Curtobacterium sp. MCBD17_040]WIB65495.1 hypothetical protein DEI94_19165 [Curtobacterium sp. MCBD17_040]